MSLGINIAYVLFGHILVYIYSYRWQKTVLWYIIACLLHLVMQCRNSCRCANQISQASSHYFHVCSIGDKFGDHVIKKRCWTSSRACRVVPFWWALFYWSSTLSSCCRNDSRMEWTIFWMYMALCNVSFINIKVKQESSLWNITLWCQGLSLCVIAKYTLKDIVYQVYIVNINNHSWCQNFALIIETYKVQFNGFHLIPQVTLFRCQLEMCM